MEQQIDLLLDFGDANLLMEQALRQFDEIDLSVRAIYDAWTAGDSEALNRLLLEDDIARDPKFRDVYTALFDDRNITMTEKISAYLRGSGSYFVVVGAGHLVGKEGIIALLRRRGFEVKQF